MGCEEQAGSGPRRTAADKLAHSAWKRFRAWYARRHVRRFRAWLDLRERGAAEGDGPQLTADEFTAISRFWSERYGLSVYDTVYRMVKRFTGETPDPRYIANDLFFMELLPALNPIEDSRVFADKSLAGFYFEDFRRPREFFRCVRGVCYDGHNEVVSRGECAALALACDGPVIVKPTVDSGEGRGVGMRRFGSVAEVESLFADYAENFTVQEVVVQSEETKAFNPTSLNTFRIVTLFLNGRFSVLASVLRVGGKGNLVDNVGAGGFGVGVGPDGALQPFAHDAGANKVLVGHDGSPLAGRRIPSFPRVLEFVERLHRRLPYVGLIGWDVALDGANEPVLIELNAVKPGVTFVQLASGPLFGDRFGEVMDYVKDRVRRKPLSRGAGAFRADAQFPEVVCW